jgi:hypothetical protein
VSDGYLESSLLSACPGLRESWTAARRTHRPPSVPDVSEFLAHVRLHVVGLLAAGRVAEFTRFARSMERLLGEADPVLLELLRDQLVRPLAREVQDANISRSLVEPHLGTRMKKTWPVARDP